MVSNPAAPPPPPIEAVEPAAEPLRMSALLEPREEAPGGSAVSPHGPLAALSKGSRAGCFFLIRFLRSLSSACRPKQKGERGRYVISNIKLHISYLIHFLRNI